MIQTQQAKGRLSNKIGTFFSALGTMVALVVITLSAQADLEIDNTYALLLKHLPESYPALPDPDYESTLDEITGHPGIALSDRRRREVILQALSGQPGKHGNTIITPHAVKDLRLVSGTTLKPEKNLLKNLGKPITVTGEVMLANALITPIPDINILEQRQKALQYLLDHPQLNKQLQTLLRRIAADEDGFLVMYEPSDVVNTRNFSVIEDITQSIFPVSSSSGFECSRRLGEFGSVFNSLLVPNLTVGTTTVVGFVVYYYLGASFWNALTNAPHFAWEILKGSYRDFAFVFGPGAAKAYYGYLFIIQGIITYQVYKKANEERKAYTFLMERARRPGRVINAATKLAELLHNHPTFANILTHVNSLTRLDEDSELSRATYLLDNPPDRQPSAVDYYLSHMGRYKEGFNILRNSKDKLLRIIQALGEVDAWLTVSKLVQQSQKNEKNAYTFVSFTNSERPGLSLSNFWNPHLSAEIAVPSSITLGQNNPQNLLVTGPNAAGKSTAIEGVAITAILAQTFGIAPAETAEITPFSFIHTHMDISAEIATGLSSFKAESVRAIELMDHLQKMNSDQFSMAIMDEVFNSTNPEEGEAGTYGYLKTVAQFPNAINISTTHYAKPMMLAQHLPETFLNMHVSADIGSDDKLRYDYYLKPGYSMQHVAIQLLKEQGLQSDFLDTANDVIAHPDKYSTK